jgi:hypothetical protein
LTAEPIPAFARFPVGGPSPVHDLARAFHAGDPAALERVVEIVESALRAQDATLPATAPAGVVVVPGHLPGTVTANCLALAARLAADAGWPAPATAALERIAPAPEARSSVTRAPEAEAATLRWHPDRLPRKGVIILLDDVVRSGSTLQAAVLAAPPALAGRLQPLAVFRADVMGPEASEPG